MIVVQPSSLMKFDAIYSTSGLVPSVQTHSPLTPQRAIKYTNAMYLSETLGIQISS